MIDKSNQLLSKNQDERYSYNLHRMIKIKSRIIENNYDVTLQLPIHLDYISGQFIMVWIPGIGEKPFSIAGNGPEGIFITIRPRGIFSRQLINLDIGSLIGLRGPYGKGFRLIEKGCIIVGGVGFACVASIAQRFPNIPILYGENSNINRIYQKRFFNVKFYTMDGTGGKRGSPIDDLEFIIQQNNCNMVYCCGPELMMVKVIQICYRLGIECQVAIERYMKCGLGICGQCVCGADLVCFDGPVFDGFYILKNSDFGKRKLDASGTWNII